MELPNNASDMTFVAKYTQKKHVLEQKCYEWELLSEELEQKKKESAIV